MGLRGSLDTDTNLITPISVPNGGTGRVSALAFAVLCGGTTSTAPQQSIASVGTSGQILTSNGPGALPTFETSALTTPISVPNGGTGVTSLLNRGILLGSGTGPVTVTAEPSDGQLLIGVTGADPQLSSLTQPAAGITITTGASSITFALDDDLAAVESLGGVGLTARTAANVWATRTLTGTTDRIFIDDGGGITGNPAIDISASFVGQTSMTTLGTITTGTWNGSAIPVANGGTGSTGITGVVSGNGTTYAGRTITGTANRIDVANGNGSAANPTINISTDYAGQSTIGTLGTVVTGVWEGTDVDVPHGGSGRSSSLAFGVICGGTTSTTSHQSISSVGTSGQVLTSLGPAIVPAFQDAPLAAVQLIATATASNDATIEFNNLSSSFQKYEVVITGLKPVTDAVQFWMRTSSNNGVSFDTGASDYQWATEEQQMALVAATVINSDNTDAQMVLGGADAGLPLGNAADQDGFFQITIADPTAALFTKITCQGVYEEDGPFHVLEKSGGLRDAAASVDAIQFLMSSGNISVGEFRLYGYTNA